MPEECEEKIYKVDNSQFTHQVTKFIQAHAEARFALLELCIVLLYLLLVFLPHHSSMPFFILEINATENSSSMLNPTQADQVICSVTGKEDPWRGVSGHTTPSTPRGSAMLADLSS